MITPVAALANGTRVPVPDTDDDGTPCLLVPLDDRGETYARVERQDYEYIILTLGCRAAWYLGGARGRRKYVRVNAPYGGGQVGGNYLVVRLFPGIGPLQRVRYATSDTLDLRRRNLIIEAIQDGRNLDGGTLMMEAVRRREAVLKREADEKKRPRISLVRHYIWET